MKKISKKTKVVKKINKRYIKAPTKSAVAYFSSAAILTLALVGALAAMMLVDKNCSAVGWNRQRTELAFNSTGQQLEITVMDNSFTLSTTPFKTVADVYCKVNRVADYIKPAPVRMADMLYALIDAKLTSFKTEIVGAFKNFSFKSLI